MTAPEAAPDVDDLRGIWVDRAALHAALRAHLRARGRTFADLSRETGIAGTTFSRLRHGRDLSVDNLAILTTYLGRPAEDFYRRPDEVTSTDGDPWYRGRSW